MQHISTTVLVIVLVIVVNRGNGATAPEPDSAVDQIAEETRSRNRTIFVVEAPKNATQPPAKPLRDERTPLKDDRYPFRDDRTPLKDERTPFRDERTPLRDERTPLRNDRYPLPDNNTKSEQVTLSQPPFKLIPEKSKIIKYVSIPRGFFAPVSQKINQIFHNGKPLYPGLQPNTVYKYPNVLPLTHRPIYSSPPRPKQPNLVFAGTTGMPVIITASSNPKFSLPIQTINGIKGDFVRPPKLVFSSSSTTTSTTTTEKPIRNKRIWPKHILDKKNGISSNDSSSKNATSSFGDVTKNLTDHSPAASNVRVRFVNRTAATTPLPESTTRVYRRVTRVPSVKMTTPKDEFAMEPNDWVPIIPSHYAQKKIASSRTDNVLVPSIRRSDSFLETGNRRSDSFLEASNRRSDYFLEQPYGMTNSFLDSKKKKADPFLDSANRRSDSFLESTSRRSDTFLESAERRSASSRPKQVHSYSFLGGTNNDFDEAQKRGMLYLQSYGLVPVNKIPNGHDKGRKMIFFRKRRNLNQGYFKHAGRPSLQALELQTEASEPTQKVVTKVKHHHHHHHHRYVKTVEKPVQVPVRVEVPKPYPVTVEKKVPVPYPVPRLFPQIVEKKVMYPVRVEKRVPYPVEVKVPHPVPVRVVEKEYVPKPYPVIHHVVKNVEVKVPQPVPVPYEKQVPYPVQVKVPFPVDRPVPVPVSVEKQVPYPVPVRVLVPQPYPVETRVPYPVQVKVKEPVEVIKHVPVRVPFPQPYAVGVPVPQPVRVEVEKKVPYPVEVEKRVPVPFRVFVPQRVEVEKKVPVYVPQPYPVEKKVPVPYRVPYPVKVPVQVPVQVPVFVSYETMDGTGSSQDNVVYTGYTVSDDDTTVAPPPTATANPQIPVSVNGGSGYRSFASRSDVTTSEPTVSSSTDKD